MPILFKGIGTHFYGRRNIYERPDRCKFCGHPGRIGAYDTTLFFVVFFVPIISLGQKRVLSHCKRCKRRKTMPLGKWRALKSARMTEAIDLYESDPSDHASVQNLLVECSNFVDNETFYRIADVVEEDYRTDGNIQLLLGLLYMMFGDPAAAEGRFRAVLAAENATEDEARVAGYRLGDSLIAQLRPDEARPYIMPILEDEVSDYMGLPITLAQGYSAIGRHSEALDLLFASRSIFPVLAKEKWFTKLEKITRKALKTGKPIGQRETITNGIIMEEGGWWSFHGPRLVMIAALITSSLAWLIATLMLGQARPIFLVNGLDHPYIVKIAGVQAKVPPHQYVEVKIPEGEWRAEAIRDPGATPIEPLSVKIRTPFLTRVFLKSAFVINPDRVAPIYWQRIAYENKIISMKSREDSSRVWIGKPVYRFSGIDYQFQKPPKTVRSAWGMTARRERITLLDEAFPLGRSSIVRSLSEFVSERERIEALKRYVQLEPDASMEMATLAQTLDPKPLTEFLKPGLELRPIRLQWHLAYQNAARTSDELAKLREEYHEALNAAPGDPNLKYLLGRLSQYTDVAQRLFADACSAEPPVPYACVGFANNCLSMGRMTEGLDLLSKTVKANPRDIQIRENYEAALLANSKFEEFARSRALDRTASPHEIAAEAVAMELSGHGGEVGKMIQRRVIRLTDDGRQRREITKDIKAEIAAQRAYAQGKLELFLQLSKAAGESLEVERMVTGGEFQAITRLLDETEGSPDTFYDEIGLCVYIALMQSGRQSEANSRYEKVVARLNRELSVGDAYVRRLLTGEIPLSRETLLSPSWPPNGKRVLLVALGLRFPESRALCFEIVRVFNASPFFPRLLLDSMIHSQPSADGAESPDATLSPASK